MKPYTVLVTGGRYYDQRQSLFWNLDRLVLRPELLVNGGATGADALSTEWAKLRGISFKEYPVLDADWKQFGFGAGPRRNTHMLKDAQPALVIAFPGGRGTNDMVRKAERAGVPVLKINDLS